MSARVGALIWIWIAGCGPSRPPAREPVASHEEPAPAPAVVAQPPPPTTAQTLLAQVPEGTLLLFVELQEAERRLSVLGRAEPTERSEGDVIESWFGGVRLEEAAPAATREITLLRGEPCSVDTTQTFRAEVWSEDHPEDVRAVYVAEATTGCAFDGDYGGGVAVMGTRAGGERVELEVLSGASRRRMLARIPRGLTPRPPAPGVVSARTIGDATAVVASSEPDLDGCVYDEVTYVLRSDAGHVFAGFPERVVRVGGRTVLLVVDASGAAGRPATHVRAFPLDDGPKLLDTDVSLPWMTVPSC